MSTFTARNIEYDNASDSDVDDTKELQIEEALKLYQAAIKYHSEGPQSYKEAAAAYTELFESEIFQYSESLSELRRLELFGSLPEYQELYQTDFDPVAQPLIAVGDSAPNTLPQIIHLSYKNHGQFLLDVLQHKVQVLQLSDQPRLTSDQIKIAAEVPINHFAEALDKDDTDLDLWRCSASVARFVGSSRIARYCLEAILDGDSEGLDNFLGPPGIEDGLALHELQSLVDGLKDDLALLTAPLNSFRKKNLSAALKTLLNPYPRMRKPSFESTTFSLVGQLGRAPTRNIITAQRRDWAAIGEIMIKQLSLEQEDQFYSGPGVGIGFKLPEQSADAAVDESDPVGEAPVAVNNKSLEEKGVQLELVESPLQEDKEAGGKPILKQEDTISNEVATEDAASAQDEAKPPDERIEQQISGPPSRKRSTDSAGLGEVAEGGRIRSKRIRARETLEVPIADATVVEANKNSEEDLRPFSLADEQVYDTLKPLLDIIQAHGLVPPGLLRNLVKKNDDQTSGSEAILRIAIIDLYELSNSWTSDTASILLHGDSDRNDGPSSRENGLNAFLGQENLPGSKSPEKPVLDTDDGLGRWVAGLNSSWTSSKDVAWMWLMALIRMGSFPGAGSSDRSTYLTHRWPERLKRTMVQVAVNIDSYVFEKAQKELQVIEKKILQSSHGKRRASFSPNDEAVIDMIETMFELHLDIYSHAKSLNNGFDHATRYSQLKRLEQWSRVANLALYMRRSQPDLDLDELSIRHIWATAVQISLSDDVSQDHIVSCIRDLKKLMHSLDGLVIQLPNSVTMPELSETAAEQRISQMNMKDFFLKVFSDEEKDPVTVIESLEPLLEMSHVSYQESPDSNVSLQDMESPSGQLRASSHSPSQMEEMSSFLSSRSVWLRLSLWTRLQEAYESIEYQPKIVSCHLRGIELLMNEFGTPSYTELDKQQRTLLLLRWLRSIDISVTKILSLRSSIPHFLECIDAGHLQSSMSAVARLSSLLHAPSLFDDAVRLELAPLPSVDGRRISYATMVNRINDMQIRAWMLQYLLLKEAIEQFPERFPSPAMNRLEFLSTVHNAAGLRGACAAAGHMFLRFLVHELLSLSDLPEANIQLCQVLWDLYGLRCFQNPADLVEHDADAEPLTKFAAVRLLGFLLTQAQKMSMKDLPKADLKLSIDKVHSALGRPKVSEDISHNRRICNAFLKAPINPLNLYSSIRGTFDLPTKPVSPSDAPIAEKGWYFLMANAALYKFRSIKRLSPGPTDDLDSAVSLFLQDLEYSTEQWETWYRLAQTYDTQLEECVSWSAEKLNSHSNDVNQYQRSAINAYTMAISCAVRAGVGSEPEESRKKIGELYSDFGNRIYASSREPFSMRVFSVKEDEERHFNSSQMYRGPPFELLKPHNAWKFAAALFRQAIRREPDQWPDHYMLGKCLWKMWTSPVEDLSPKAMRVEFDDALECISQAIEKLPSRDSRKDPILEPHYKLVSMVHKLVTVEALEPKAASDILKATLYASSVSPPVDLDGWEPYVLSILKNLRSADKSGWHHRMTARAAQIVYDGSGNDMFGAMGAKHELTQQMFTKTMAVQVWKPEFERPGRHFVYTTRYVRFFIDILDKTGDAPNFEALARRLRRKPHDFFEHTKLWQDSCFKYLKLLRRSGNIPEGHEDAVFKSLNHEEFSQRATALEMWCHANSSSTLDTLREVIELKKLNNGLMKATLIDDLVGDTYARLYEEVAGTLSVSQTCLPNPTDQPAKVTTLEGTGVINMRGVPGSDQAPIFHGYPPQQPSEHVTKPRAKGVGRRELQKRAEAAVARPLTQSTTVTLRGPSTPLQQQSTQMLGVVVSNSTAQLRELNGGEESPHTSGEGASVPGSVHDSADDESGSELSGLNDQIEDDEEVKPTIIKSMFPGLAVAASASLAATTQPGMVDSANDTPDDIETPATETLEESGEKTSENEETEKPAETVDEDAMEVD